MTGGVTGLLVVVGLVVFVPVAVIGVLLLPMIVGLVLALIVAAAVVWFLHRDIDARALASTGARPLRPEQAPRLANLVDGVADLVGIAAPDLAVVDGSDLDAGVVGYRGSGVLIVTSGLLDSVERVELEGVVARELVVLRAGLASRRTVAHGLVGWFAGGLGTRLAGPAPSLDDDVAVDLAAVRVTRFPPGLSDALRGCAGSDAPTRPASAALWMVGDGAAARSRLEVRAAALDEL